MRVRDVLSSKGSGDVYTVRPDATVSELLDKLAELNVGALIVSDDGQQLLGIVSERDVVRKIRDFGNTDNTSVESIMTTDVRVCAPDDSFGSLMGVMCSRKVSWSAYSASVTRSSTVWTSSSSNAISSTTTLQAADPKTPKRRKTGYDKTPVLCRFFVPVTRSRL
jgi:D-serine deaminase-like pyridoxal phosphate-dependent protein